jgi:hypothetical protein
MLEDIFMRLSLPLALLALSPAAALRAAEAPAGPAAKPAASRVVSVTVYQSSALVTREVTVPDAAGVTELVVASLPPQVVQNSLYAEGGAGLRILSTRARSRAVREDTREEVRKIDAQIKTAQAAHQETDAAAKALDQNLALLGKLEGFTAATMQHLAEKGLLNSEATIALAKHIMDQRSEKTKELVALQQKLAASQEQIEFLQRQRNEFAARSSRTEIDGVVVIDKAAPGPAAVRLSYLVESASWRPQYKLRAGKGREPVVVEYLAAIEQRTGEDWNGVNLVLSTAQPMLNAAPPDLQELDVTVVSVGAPNPAGQPGAGPGGEGGFMAGQKDELRQQAAAGRAAAQSSYNSRDFKKGTEILNTVSAREQAWELLASKEAGQLSENGHEGPTVTYRPAGRLSLPSRNDEQVVEVTRFELTPDYFYKSVPVLTPHVYRLATLTNRSEYVLLPGEATMYLGTDFVGRSKLPLVAIGEQFTAGFGVDPQVQVARKLLDKNRTTQGGNQVLTFDYQILVSSYKGEPVRLQVWDRLPSAEKQTVAVTLVSQKPEVSHDPLYQREERAKNLLRWDVTVEPNSYGEKALAITYGFRMELDRTLRIGAVTTK